MPEFTLPVTAEQWAAVTPNETDQLLHDAMSNDAGALQLAAASRLLERERCVERVADQLAGGEGKSLDALPAHERAVLVEAARRILEDK